MKAKTAQLAPALARLLPVLRTRTTMPILTTVKLCARAGALQITATDLDVFARAVCPCEGEDFDPVCVDATTFNYLIKEAEEIELKVVGPRLLVAGVGKAYLTRLEAAEFPTWPEYESQELDIEPADLASCINLVSWATDTNPKISLDFWKECVWVKGTAQGLQCCGTTGKEFAHVNADFKGCNCEFMFPSRHAKLLVDSLNLADEVLLSDKFILTTSASFQVAVNLATGRYIAISFLLDQTVAPLGPLPIVPILGALHAIKVMGQGEAFQDARIEFTPETITILYQSDRGNFEQAILCPFERTPATIRVDVAKAIHVFSHLPPDHEIVAGLGANTLVFKDGGNTYALGLLIGNKA